MRKTLLYTSVGGLLVALASQPAAAQNSASGKQVMTIEEVVVTAQRFSESVQRTALAIEVISGDELQGVSDVRQLQTISPGVSLSAAGNVVQTYVRGVGSQNATNQQEAAVAYNLDGVYLATTTMISPQLFDLQRVEVLKGPQGTLYGRNASGGAVNLISNGASLEGVEGFAEGEVGSYDLRRLTAAVNVPLSDTFAVRLAGQHLEHEGYLSDGADDQDVTSGRLRALWKPNSTVSLIAGFDASQMDAVGAGSSLNPNPTSDGWIGGTDPVVQTGMFFGASLLSFPPNPPPHLRDEQWGAFAQLDVDLGFATLTVLPAYRDEDLDSRNYVPGYEYGEQSTTKQTSLEARLSNRTDALRWVLGAYYFKNEQHLLSTVRYDGIGSNVVADVDTDLEAWALFGEATYSLTETFRVIAGLRYTEEEATFVGNNNARLGLNSTNAFNPFNPFTNPTGELLDYSNSSPTSGNAVTWKIGFEYDLAPDSLLFATVSRGFKGGGSYLDLPGQNTTYDPEYVTAYEIGSRNRFLDGALQLNGELFYWEIKDQQIPYVGYNSIPAPTFLTANAGQATMYGANVDVTWRATPNDTLHLGVEYLHAEYDSFVRDVPSFSVLLPTACRVTALNPATARVDCSGRDALRAPEWAGSASYEHRFDLSGGADLTFDTDVTFASSRELYIHYNPVSKDDAYALWNASLTYHAPEDQFAVSGWVKNITEERVLTGGGQNVANYFRPTLLPPRTYGVSLRYNF